MIFKVRHFMRGQHVVCDIFAAPSAEETFARLGTLYMRSEEFAAFKHKQYSCIFEETEGAQ